MSAAELAVDQTGNCSRASQRLLKGFSKASQGLLKGFSKASQRLLKGDRRD